MPLGRNKGSKDTQDGGFAALKEQRKMQRIQRGDVVEVATPSVDSTPTKANLLQVKKPHFITAVGLPANETAFKVVREDKNAKDTKDTSKEPKNMNHPIIRRTRRSETNPVLRITFPAGVDEDTVNTALKTYGLDGYKVEQNDGLYTATRADLKSITKDKTTDITLTEDGLVATVARSSGGLSTHEPKSCLTIARFEFDSNHFSVDEVKRWATENAVDGEVQEPQNPDECYVVRRSDVPENEETRRMVLEDGVHAVIVRSDVMDVPEGYVAVVNETAYGSWGWGQLDFMATLGDMAFCDSMRAALGSLDDVLRSIVIYSSLPLDIRKELANRALVQFGDYIGNVMDSLPRQLLASVVRSANTQQEKDMTQKDVSAATTPEAKTEQATPEVKTPEAVETKTGEFVTRADAQKMVDEAVAKAVTAVRAETPKSAVAAVAKADPDPEPDTKDKTVSRADLESAVAALVAPMTDAIKALQGTTIVRSAPEPIPEKDDGKPKDVFRGSFGGLRVAKR